MRIGIDFDNTIACYDGVFHMAAVERGLIPADTGTDKTSVRSYLRGIEREDAWTELQGYVYGARMDLVALFPGVHDFVRAAVADGHTVFIISHKTKTPFRGPKYDLHAAARRFLETQGLVDPARGGIPPEHTFLELTIEEKLRRIATQACDVFIDDLPEFLAEPAFPAATRPILFDPAGHYPGGAYAGRTFETGSRWSSLAEAVLGRGT